MGRMSYPALALLSPGSGYGAILMQAQRLQALEWEIPHISRTLLLITVSINGCYVYLTISINGCKGF